jgi:allantoicase
LAPSDFYLVDYVKHCLRGQPFEAADEFFSSVEAVLRSIEESILNAAFLEWMERLEQWNATRGESFEDM